MGLARVLREGGGRGTFLFSFCMEDERIDERAVAVRKLGGK